MSPVPQPSERDTAIFRILEEHLIESLRNVFTNHYKVSIISSVEGTSFQAEPPSCNWISSSINFHGNMAGIIILIAENLFAHYLLATLGLGVLKPEEEKDYIQDAMGEFLNVILGNTTNDLLKKDIELNIEPPELFILDDGNIGEIFSNSWQYEVHTDQGKFCLVVKAGKHI